MYLLREYLAHCREHTGDIGVLRSVPTMIEEEKDTLESAMVLEARIALTDTTGCRWDIPTLGGD